MHVVSIEEINVRFFVFYGRKTENDFLRYIWYDEMADTFNQRYGTTEIFWGTSRMLMFNEKQKEFVEILLEEQEPVSNMAMQSRLKSSTENEKYTLQDMKYGKEN